MKKNKVDDLEYFTIGLYDGKIKRHIERSKLALDITLMNGDVCKTLEQAKAKRSFMRNSEILGGTKQ